MKLVEEEQIAYRRTVEYTLRLFQEDGNPSVAIASTTSVIPVSRSNVLPWRLCQKHGIPHEELIWIHHWPQINSANEYDEFYEWGYFTGGPSSEDMKGWFSHMVGDRFSVYELQSFLGQTLPYPFDFETFR